MCVSKTLAEFLKVYVIHSITYECLSHIHMSVQYLTGLAHWSRMGVKLFLNWNLNLLLPICFFPQIFFLNLQSCICQNDSTYLTRPVCIYKTVQKDDKEYIPDFFQKRPVLTCDQSKRLSRSCNYILIFDWCQRFIETF